MWNYATNSLLVKWANLVVWTRHWRGYPLQQVNKNIWNVTQKYQEMWEFSALVSFSAICTLPLKRSEIDVTARWFQLSSTTGSINENTSPILYCNHVFFLIFIFCKLFESELNWFTILSPIYTSDNKILMRIEQRDRAFWKIFISM